MPNKKFKSDAFEAIHSSATGLYRAGGIDKTTMREFDESCLAVPPDFEFEEMWLDEAERRAAEIDNGLVKLIPAAEVSRKARTLLK
jgi:DNA-binding transcriptional regulator YiaG